MANIKFDDINIYYEVHGDGTPLILISGYTCDHTFWSSLVDKLAKQFKVIVFDNRAIGRTQDSGAQFNIETMADDVIKLSYKLELTNPYIIGQSMGGTIAQTIAMKYPKLIRKLILLNTAMKFNVASLMALENIIMLRKLNVPLDVIIDASLPWVFSSHYLEITNNVNTFKKLITDNPYPQSIEDQDRQLTALRLFDSLGWVSNIKVPTMVIASKNDILALPTESHELAQMSNALFKTLPGGHASPIEQPDRLCEIILTFFK